MNLQARRKQIRQILTARRQTLTPVQRITAAQGLKRVLEQIPRFHEITRVAGYWASDGELPLNFVTPWLTSCNQIFLLPVISPGRTLVFAPWRVGNPVKANRYGIPEPESVHAYFTPSRIDLVLMPLLAFDRRGQRLGHGGGYYDRAFAFLKEQNRPGWPLLIGIAYAFQEIAHIDEQPWDIRLDYVATDQEFIDCHDTAGNVPT